jgi:hypothetical protein
MIAELLASVKKDPTLIKESVGELLLEAEQSSRIKNAIQNRYVIQMYYAGDGVEKPGWRIIEVYCYGINKANRPVIRAWQREGTSATPNGDGKDPLKKMPGWRMYRLDRIRTFRNYGEVYNGTTAFVQSQRPKYNAADKDMTHVIYAFEPRDDRHKQKTTQMNPHPAVPTGGFGSAHQALHGKSKPEKWVDPKADDNGITTLFEQLDNLKTYLDATLNEK